MPTELRRITAIDTIPASAALSGTVTTSTSDSTVLVYTGTVDLPTVYKAPLYATSLWIYVAVGTPKVVQVTGISFISLVTGTYTFAIQLAEAMTGASASTILTVNADLLGYSFKGDGGAAFTANGISMPNGTVISEPQLALAGSRVTFHPPVLINASGTSVLVVENS